MKLESSLRAWGGENRGNAGGGCPRECESVNIVNILFSCRESLVKRALHE